MQNVKAPLQATLLKDALDFFASDANLSLEPADRHFLFVTGPFGGFTPEVGRRLRAAGARATRILLNAGDALDWGLQHCAAYRGKRSDWAGWIDSYMEREAVSDLIVFGDSHPYCADAIVAAKRQGAKVHVLEEGYFRPHWITLERDGVNGVSSLPRNPDFYRRNGAGAQKVDHVPVGKITPAAVSNISIYHTVQVLGGVIFPHYKTPNPYGPIEQSASHVRRYVAQRINAKRYERALQAVLGVSGPIFLALLQRPGDSQLLRHSSFHTVAAFAEHVIASFAKHAPAGTRLLLKSHPLDHGIERHDEVIRRAAENCGVADRVYYTQVGHFPSLVRASVGVVSVNSTGGLTAIEFQRPTAVLGSAIYDMPGLTHQGGLDRFWVAPEAPDPALYMSFRNVVMAKTQINGAYSTAHGVNLAAPELTRRLLVS